MDGHPPMQDDFHAYYAFCSQNKCFEDGANILD
jgi:hypothetical protein